jgi:glycosyltransferase involved in cell wall biosynthesis
MNILFVDQFNERGGGQAALLDLLPGIIARGWEAHVALPPGGPLFHDVRALGATAHPIPCGRYSSERKPVREMIRYVWGLRPLARAIAQLAAECRAGLVYVNGPRVLLPAALATRNRIPLVFHCHSRITQPAAVRVAGEALRLAHATVAASCRYAAEPLAGYVRAERCRVVYGGVAGRAAARSGRAGSFWRIGVIGRISPEKGQAEFLRAARLLVRDVPDVTFVVCGAALFADAAALRYEQLVRDLATRLPVKFLGWRDDVDSVLADLDLLVVPSVKEPGPTRVILEAYAAGVPVVAFSSGGISEVLRDGAGFLVQPPTAEALAGAIRELRTSPGRLAAAAEAGRREWREKYTLERYRGELLELIERAASEPCSHAPAG